jgi:alkylation response protein AidB-like acyl-CoA dehydrogenase
VDRAEQRRDVTTVTLSVEQSMLAATAAQMVADHPTRDEETIAGEQTSGALWSALVTHGFLELVVAEVNEEPTLNAALVLEQLARGIAAVPYLGTALALSLLQATQPEGAEYADVLAGRPGCVVLDRRLTALAPNGNAVDVGSGALAIGVDGSAVCVSVLDEPLEGVDPSRPLAAAIGLPTIVAEMGPQTMLHWRARALAFLCADLVGACAAALEGAVAHARGRKQFGRPIGSFQAVQHLCAEQLVTVEACRSVAWYAAWAVDTLPPRESLAAAEVAKAYCAESARTVCEAAIQVWGGLGMTWQCPAHRYLRRALLDRQLLGDEHVLLATIGRERLYGDRSGTA